LLAQQLVGGVPRPATPRVDHDRAHVHLHLSFAKEGLGDLLEPGVQAWSASAPFVVRRQPRRKGHLHPPARGLSPQSGRGSPTSLCAPPQPTVCRWPCLRVRFPGHPKPLFDRSGDHIRERAAPGMRTRPSPSPADPRWCKRLPSSTRARSTPRHKTIGRRRNTPARRCTMVTLQRAHEIAPDSTFKNALRAASTDR